MSKLAAKLARLNDPNPDRFDVEDSMFDVVQRRPQYELEEDDASDNERFFAPTKRGGLKKPTKARLSIKSSELTIDDPKYAGAPVTRKELESHKRVSFDPFATVLGVDEQGNDIENNEFADDASSLDDDDNDDDDDNKEQQQQRLQRKIEHVVVAPAESDKADELARQLELDEQNERSQLQIFDSNNDAELQQARATKNQTKLLDHVFDLRIRQQRALLLSRRLPSRDNTPDDDEKLNKFRESASTACIRLLRSLDELRMATSSSSSLALQDSDNSSELIWKRLSAIEEQASIDRRPALAELSSRLTSTTLAKGKRSFASMNTHTDIESQVKRIMSDQDRVLKRCRTTRSSYQVVGESEEVIARGGARRRSENNDAAADDEPDENENEVSRELAAQRRALKKAKQAQDKRQKKTHALNFTIQEKLVNFATPVPRPACAWDVDAFFENIFH